VIDGMLMDFMGGFGVWVESLSILGLEMFVG